MLLYKGKFTHDIPIHAEKDEVQLLPTSTLDARMGGHQAPVA